MRTLSFRAGQKGLELVCHVDPDVPDLLVGDAGRLRQVIINLVGNSIKFTERGEIVLRVHRQPGEGLTLRFDVHDTGIGIPADRRNAIFEPFEQVDGSITRRFGGTGLGLAISSQLVSLMGGRMWLESEVGQGTQFHFTAQFDLVEGQEDASGLKEPPDVHGLRVLIVDDNATHREILQELFTNWRMAPTLAASTQEALDELHRAANAGQPYPIVLADGVMPAPDGYALTQQIQAQPGLAGAVILMVGAWEPIESADPAAKREGRGEARLEARLGARATLLKPLKQSELLDTLLRVVSTSLPQPTRLIVQSPVVPARQLPSLRILLAEDSVINQRLAVRLLEKAGHQVVVASNGQIAVDRWQAERFDLVLMDIQMPEMGGFEATAVIRERERPDPEGPTQGRNQGLDEKPGERRSRHTPIIALTAHAMKGDRERCLQAGMDAYVSKPIREAELFAAIEQVLQTHAPERLTQGRQLDPETPPSPPEEPPTMSAVYDLNEALERCGGDRGLLRELIDLFLADMPQQMTNLQLAIQEKSVDTIYRLAHTIKGAVATFGAEQARLAALELELMGRTGQQQPLLTSLERLRVRLEELARELNAFQP
jgi:CheY-like chemotaxis protein/HPt (histidine-containing phosphotransfer) domain-containing protein